MTASEPEFSILFDGDCPLCLREIALLRSLDRNRGRLGLIDISAPGFEPAIYGVELPTLMARIHGVLPNGKLVEGMEVFRRSYAAVGLGWLLAPSGWPVLRPAFDAAYRCFARNRLWLTGRDACEIDTCVSSAAPARASRHRAP